jgi:hypothetical protein
VIARDRTASIADGRRTALSHRFGDGWALKSANSYRTLRSKNSAADRSSDLIA